MSRIGVFVCQCGNNIKDTVDTQKVAERAKNIPGVVHTESCGFLCSSPGQQLVKEIIKTNKLDKVVVAACSPHMHEKTFRKASEAAGINPFQVEIANIREHCSWVHHDPTRQIGTDKSLDITRMTVERVRRNGPLEKIKVAVTKRALVIGGGVAGIQAALDIAEGGHEVVLVEKEPSIGGQMSKLSETFPTMDCSQCILTPKMVECAQHPNITLYTYSEVESVDGYVGNFTVTIRKKARSVIEDKCTECGECTLKCPFLAPNDFDSGMAKRKLIDIPFPQAVPAIPVLDRSRCPKYTKGKMKCGVCMDACGPDCIDFDQEDEFVAEKFGAIVVATGYEVMGVDRFPEFGGGRYKDVITGLDFERLASASGPTGGAMKRPSDGKEPRRVVFIECSGSRDESKGIPYCSNICCMYTAKHAMLYKHKVHEGQAYVFYMDIRCGGKRYEEFHRRAVEQEGAVYLRGRVSRVYERNGSLVVQGADTLSGSQVEMETDLVVLATAVLPRAGAKDLGKRLQISYDEYGFYNEGHPKLRPVETATAGIFLAGACIGPVDIPTSVSQGLAAASKVLTLFSSDELTREPVVAAVNPASCNACWDCEVACPVRAIYREDIKDRAGQVIRQVAKVNAGVCIGCGICVAACHSKTIDLAGYTDAQIHAAICAV